MTLAARAFSRYFIVLFLALATLGLARDFEKLPADQVEEIFVTTDDGVAEKLIHLRNPGKPILLMEPGLGAQGLSLEIPATAMRMRGDYDIFIGNWRGSAKLPEGMKLLGERNGLPEIVRKDFPAHLRHILNSYASAAQKKLGITLFGHSMGGMMIMGSLSDPRLMNEFKPFIRSIVLFQSPHHAKYLQLHMKAFAHVGIPMLEALKAAGIRTIDMHTRLLDRMQRSKQSGGIQGNVITPAIENFAIMLTRLALNPAYTGRETMRRAFFKMSADTIPVDLMSDFSRATLNDGQFVDETGAPLIRPELIRDIPIQMVRSKLDTLATWKEQGEYFAELGTQLKQLLSLKDMNHIDSVMFTEEEVDFFNNVIKFMHNPEATVAEARTVDFQPYCESLFTRIKLKFRRRGI
ncbi:MAG: hypothetical protein HY074_16070 [Deltaproteobacteria bacterium]|nr:hypothetical protein [Deltaproteobacteria bacterium]